MGDCEPRVRLRKNRRAAERIKTGFVENGQWDARDAQLAHQRAHHVVRNGGVCIISCTREVVAWMGDGKWKREPCVDVNMK